MNDFTGRIKRDEWKPPSGEATVPLAPRSLLYSGYRIAHNLGHSCTQSLGCAEDAQSMSTEGALVMGVHFLRMPEAFLAPSAMCVSLLRAYR